MQGCHAGLLQHQDLAANKGISTALNSIMRQFSGFDTEACDMEVCHQRHNPTHPLSLPLQGRIDILRAAPRSTVYHAAQQQSFEKEVALPLLIRRSQMDWRTI